jgi:hypothetical protein
MSGVNVYCPRHRQKERLSAFQAEQLMQAALADEECEPNGDRIFAGDDATAHLDTSCPTGQLADFRDPEVYAEHIESYVESRRAHRAHLTSDADLAALTPTDGDSDE